MENKNNKSEIPDNLLVRCSSLHNLMTKGTGKSPKDKYLDAVKSLYEKEEKYRSTANKETKTAMKLVDTIAELRATIKALKPYRNDISLSETCRTWIKKIAQEAFYGYKTQVNSKYCDKGNMVEDDSIELLNSVLFTDYKKNVDRKQAHHADGVDWLTGECDIYSASDRLIRDIKSSWSIETFPAFQEDAEKKIKLAGYDWQMRGYMILWNASKAIIDVCLVDTPPELLSDYDNWELHEVEHIAPEKRITSVVVERSESIEVEIMERYNAANKFYKECINQLKSK